MRQIAYLLIAVAMVAGVVALGTTHADAQAPPIFVTNIPPDKLHSKSDVCRLDQSGSFGCDASRKCKGSRRLGHSCPLADRLN